MLVDLSFSETTLLYRAMLLAVACVFGFFAYRLSPAVDKVVIRPPYTMTLFRPTAGALFLLASVSIVVACVVYPPRPQNVQQEFRWLAPENLAQNDNGAAFPGGEPKHAKQDALARQKKDFGGIGQEAHPDGKINEPEAAHGDRQGSKTELVVTIRKSGGNYLTAADRRSDWYMRGARLAVDGSCNPVIGSIVLGEFESATEYIESVQPDDISGGNSFLYRYVRSKLTKVMPECGEKKPILWGKPIGEVDTFRGAHQSPRVFDRNDVGWVF
jgi:hypothetical protein